MEKKSVINAGIKAEKVLIEHQGKRFALSKQLLAKYEISASPAVKSEKMRTAGRWYELGESDCF